MRRLRTHAPLVLAMAFVALETAWALCVPPFDGVDEGWHYLRALAMGHGQGLGEKASHFDDPNVTPAQRAWILQAARELDVPAGLSPDGYACNAFHPEKPAACVANPLPEASKRVIPCGTYQPAAYALPGLAMRLGTRPGRTLLLGRLTIALMCGALMMLALLSLRRAAPRAGWALLVACTPMVLFLGGIVNPSGIEVVSALCLFAGLIAIERNDSVNVAWSAAAVGAFVLALSRSTGGVYQPALIGVWAVGLSKSRALELWRNAPKRVLAVATVALVGIIGNRVWESLYGPKVPLDTYAFFPTSWHAFQGMRGWLDEEIGAFQYADTWMPRPAYAIAEAAIAVLWGVALIVGDARDRRRLVASIGLSLVTPVLLEVLVFRPTEWVVQGRYILSLTVCATLLAGEIISRRASHKLLRPLVSASLVVWAATQLTGFAANAHRSSVGTDGSWWFLTESAWAPPLGWTVWFGVVIAALTAMVVVARVRPETAALD